MINIFSVLILCLLSFFPSFLKECIAFQNPNSPFGVRWLSLDRKDKKTKNRVSKLKFDAGARWNRSQHRLGDGCTETW
jgi:hypothetical protein